MPSPFSFTNLSKGEKGQFDKDKKEIAKITQQTIEQGQACLESDMFRQYVEEYNRMEKKLIDIGISTEITEPNHYNALCRQIFANLKVLRMLIGNVKKDATR